MAITREFTLSRLANGRGWAYTGALAGGGVSIAANIAHSLVPPSGVPAGWMPEPGAVVGAIVWPVFLFIAVEILARVAWPAGWRWAVARYGGLLPVAIVAALVSYRHLSGLLAHYGEEPIVYVLGPLAVDGLMVMATSALIATGRQRNLTSTQSVIEPVTASVSASSASATTLTPIIPTTVAPAGIPGLTPAAVPIDIHPATPTPVSSPTRAEVPTPTEVAARITTRTTTPMVTATVPRSPAKSADAPASMSTDTPVPRLAPSTTDRQVTASDAAQLALPLVSPDLLARATRVAKQYQTEHGTPITAGQLAARLKVNSDLAAQALALINLDPNNNPTTLTVNGTRRKATL